LREQLSRLRLLVAIELLVAAQAVDIAAAGGELRLGGGTLVAHCCVREIVTTLGEDRALGREVTRLDEALLATRALQQRVRTATRAASVA
jgi:histidine ammonia-lyase